MRWHILALLLVAGGCSGASEPASPPSAPDATRSATAREDAGKQDAGRRAEAGAPSAASRLRIMAGNLSSGTTSTYDPPETTRLIEGLHPDIALLQELKVGNGSAEELTAFVHAHFGEDYVAYREPGVSIPNGIVSRYPIRTSGRWQDPNVNDRGFVWAKIEIPGDHPLWAVSVHLLTANSSSRQAQARALADRLEQVIGEGDHIVIGGDLNTDARTEPCVGTFARFATSAAPYPTDARGDGDTNANRNKPYDWVLVDPDLATRQVPTVLGTSEFASGLVFDSRVFLPLDDVAPIEKSDSAATNMQHMPVLRDFSL